MWISLRLIDGSLIRHLDHDKKAQHLVETVSEFARKMHIQTVAEFVDSDKVLNMVKHYQIDYAQGYLLGKPQPTIEAALGLPRPVKKQLTNSVIEPVFS
ncbi:EAL domain-containing protein [Shewanella sp. 4_MG-2023]|uniref:EAL domain-containing protein n=1 Tax=Shewanella sp. 4_MG-2023 TaxID=3062652 RepID=UPI0026E20888|nr:EAL domain-containing protein [Shewanella sp. 4_MG-2023]MDO6679097.1 EAL domain-containing protein [Shewanella sp. 4_MG-2023]